MESLLQLPAVTGDDDLKKLRELYDKIESTVRSLHSIRISQETYGTFLAAIIMAKLPKKLRLTVSRKVSDEWDAMMNGMNGKSLLAYFHDELQLREKCVLSAAAVKEKKPDYGNRRNPATTGTVAGLVRTMRDQISGAHFVREATSLPLEVL